MAVRDDTRPQIVTGELLPDDIGMPGQHYQALLSNALDGVTEDGHDLVDLALLDDQRR